jgi:hypothetical protein
MLDIIIDTLIDGIKLIPFLFIAFLIIELLEHKLSKKNRKLISKTGKLGPIFGSILGAFPQCGFSCLATNLYVTRIVSLGTLISIYLSTSDEMLPIMISEHANVLLILKIIGFKVLVGIIIGYIFDLLYRKKLEKEEIKEFCEHEHCDCEHDGIFISSLKHTLKIGLFILLANIIINLIIFYIGEENVSHLLLHHNILTYFLSSLVGLIPNCAGSVIITELYLSNMITVGTLISGLLTGSGIGILILFRTNKNLKENLTILGTIYSVGVIVGMLVDLVI